MKHVGAVGNVVSAAYASVCIVVANSAVPYGVGEASRFRVFLNNMGISLSRTVRLRPVHYVYVFWSS